MSVKSQLYIHAKAFRLISEGTQS
eukprot:COSAG01_NODE_65116_length_274_cov_0.611429_1_plen_23_part_01